MKIEYIKNNLKDGDSIFHYTSQRNADCIRKTNIIRATHCACFEYYQKEFSMTIKVLEYILKKHNINKIRKQKIIEAAKENIKRCKKIDKSNGVYVVCFCLSGNDKYAYKNYGKSKLTFDFTKLKISTSDGLTNPIVSRVVYEKSEQRKTLENAIYLEIIHDYSKNIDGSIRYKNVNKWSDLNTIDKETFNYAKNHIADITLCLTPFFKPRKFAKEKECRFVYVHNELSSKKTKVNSDTYYDKKGRKYINVPFGVGTIVGE